MATSRKTVARLVRYFIEQNRGRLPEELAAETGLSIEAVGKILSELPPPPPAPLPEPAKPDPRFPIVREKDGVTVQTGAASQFADEAMKRVTPNAYVEGNPDRCFKPRPGKPSS